MGVRLSGRGLFSSALMRPHGTGLDGGARLVSVLVGTLLIGSALLHVSAAGDHTNLPVMLAGFLVVATLQAALGGLLLFRRPGRLLLASGLALTLGSLAVWLVSRTAGLPFLPGGHMEPIGFKDGVTVMFEVATVPMLAILWSAELDGVRLPSPRLGTQAVAVLGSGMFALFVPALVLGGGEHHSAGELTGQMHGEGGHDQAGEELAQAAGAHGHAGGDGSHGGSGHDASMAAKHARGQPATADFFANAHDDLGHEQTPAADTTRGQHQHSSERQTGSHHGGGHPDGEGDTHNRPEGGGDDHAHGEDAPEHGDDHGQAADAPESPGTITFDSGQPQGEGEPTRSPAILVHEQGDGQVNGEGHSHAPCNPTAEQQAAADRIVAEVKNELVQYENNPAAALADGFDYVFGPTDRMLHVVSLDRIQDPDALKAPEIESFIYYMTDTGFVPIGGMFVMPRDSTSGPEPGGCLTQWHNHGGVVARWATAGTSDTTPLMMHVFTYPGLDPWGHYTGRDLAPLWTPGRWVPSVCRQAEDANTGCLP